MPSTRGIQGSSLQTNAMSLGYGARTYEDNQIALGDTNVTELITTASLNTSATSPLGSTPGGVTHVANGYVLTANGTGGSSWKASSGGSTSTPTLQEVTSTGVATTDVFTVFTGGAGSSSSEETKFGYLAAEGATGVFWTAFGNRAGGGGNISNTWSAFGKDAGFANTNGGIWCALGAFAGASNVSGSSWTAVGVASGRYNITGSNWVTLGTQAGNKTTSGDYATDFSNSTYVGNNTHVSANGVVNENVFGYNADGKGENTVSIGNSAITDNYFIGNVTATNFILSSDERLKTFIDEPIVDLSSIDIRKFNYKDV